jgi:hypothetical protein
MKHSYTQVTLFLSLIFQFISCSAEGFSPGTLIKIPDGYAKIEDLCIGEHVFCYDNQKNIIESPIIHIAKKSVDRYVRITTANEYLRVACNQRLYDESNEAWVIATVLKNGDNLAGHAIAIEVINEPIDLYLITVAQHHNFFVTRADICAHNFIPLVLAVSAAFGLGSVELTSVGFGIAGLGTFLGYQWHKKNKQKHTVGVSAIAFDMTQESDSIYSANDAQAPGMPTKKDGFLPPKKWDGKKKTHPITGAVGWPDKKGKIWVPTGVGPKAHGGPHWDVQYPNGIDYDNVYPGGKIRPGR